MIPRCIKVSGPVASLARREVILHYARAHDEWSTEEQRLRFEGKLIEAEGAHRTAVRVLKAYQNEIDNPEVA